MNPKTLRLAEICADLMRRAGGTPPADPYGVLARVHVFPRARTPIQALDWVQVWRTRVREGRSPVEVLGANLELLCLGYLLMGEPGPDRVGLEPVTPEPPAIAAPSIAPPPAPMFPLLNRTPTRGAS